MLGREMPWVAGNDAAEVHRYDLTEIAGRAKMDVHDLLELLQGAHALLGPDQPRYMMGPLQG